MAAYLENVLHRLPLVCYKGWTKWAPKKKLFQTTILKRITTKSSHQLLINFF